MKEQNKRYINQIRNLPNKLAHILSQLPTSELDTPYRKDGWTVRQVIHHVVDSHCNGLIRLKLILASDLKTIQSRYLGSV